MPNHRIGALAFGAATRVIDGPWAVYPNSILFKAGEYPDKGVTFTPAEVRTMAASFVPGDEVRTIDELKRLAEMGASGNGAGNVEHMDFLAGRAARIRRVWTDDSGETLFGEVAIPWAFDDLLTDDERRLSVEITAEKTLCGIALTTSPRVEDAVLMSAFSSFARHDTPDGQYKIQSVHDALCRHGAVCDKSNAQMSSKHEAQALQEMHEICVKHGAKCASTSGGSAYYNAGNGGKEKKPMPTAKEILASIGSLFTKAGIRDDEEIDNDKVADVLAGKVEMSKPSTDPEVVKLRAQVERMAKESRIKDGVAFAKSVITANKALPAEEASIAAQYVQAATDDEMYPSKVTFGVTKEGQPLTGSRVDALSAMFVSRPAHVLTQELLKDALQENPDGVALLFNRQATPDPNGEPKPFTKRSKEDLMKLTPLGTSILNGKDGK